MGSLDKRLIFAPVSLYYPDACTNRDIDYRILIFIPSVSESVGGQ